MHMIYVFTYLKLLGCLHDPISYTGFGLHLHINLFSQIYEQNNFWSFRLGLAFFYTWDVFAYGGGQPQITKIYAWFVHLSFIH